jgi:hypothetical protein
MKISTLLLPSLALSRAVTSAPLEKRQSAAPLGATPPDINDLAPAARQGIADAWVDYVSSRNLVPQHMEWHSQNGPGGTEGAGSGERFLQYHANLLNGFATHPGARAALEATGGALPIWNTTRPLPAELSYEGQETRTVTEQRPGYLTAAGLAPGEQPCEIDGRQIRSLNDSSTLDLLGRVMGECGYHASVHNELGGDMGNSRSIVLPPFLVWHGDIHQVNREWHAVEAGQAWLRENPTGWTDPGANALRSNSTQVSQAAPLSFAR